MADDQRFMEIWLQTVKEKMPGQGEAIFKKSFSTVAILALKKTTLYSMFGPFAWFLDDAVRLGLETFIEAGRRWWEVSRPLDAVFEITSTGSGLLVAESKDPDALRQFPIQLPAYAEIPVARLQQPIERRQERTLHDQLFSARQTDSNRVLRGVLQTHGRNICPNCGQHILKLTSSELGHSFTCPRNSFGVRSRRTQQPKGFPAGKCSICGRYLTRAGNLTYGHDANCLLNPDRFGLGQSGRRTLGGGTTPPTQFRLTRPSTRLRLGNIPTPRQGQVTHPKVVSAPPGNGVMIDAKAEKSLRNGKPLFPIKVQQVIGEFSTGTTIDIFDPAGKKIAKGTAQYSSTEVRRLLGHRSDEIKEILGVDRGPGVILGHTVRFVR